MMASSRMPVGTGTQATKREQEDGEGGETHGGEIAA
jgi:hypothetical protein